MKAVVWHGKRDVRVDTVPDPTIQEPTDAIIRVTSTGICGSDLHLYEVLGAVSRRGRHPRPRADGHRRGGRAGGHAHRARRPRRHPVQHLLRALLHVRPGPAVAVRDDAGARAGQGRGAVRLHEAVRPGARRPGRVPARPAGAVRPDQGAARARRTTASSTSPTCCRRPGRRSSTRPIPDGGTRRRLRPRPDRPDGAAAIALHRGAGARASASTSCPSGSSSRARTASRPIDLRDHDDIAAALRELTDGRGPDSRDRRGRHGGPRRAARQARPGPRRAPARRRRREADREGRRRPPERRCTPRSTRCGAAARSRSCGVYGGMVDPMPMMTLFDKQIQLRMGQANVKRWIDDLLPLRHGRRRSARRRGLRHAPAAARRRRREAYAMFQEKQRRRDQDPVPAMSGVTSPRPGGGRDRCLERHRPRHRARSARAGARASSWPPAGRRRSRRLVDECGRMGGQAIAMALDVGVPSAMDDLAAARRRDVRRHRRLGQQRRPVLGRACSRTRRTTSSSGSCRST